MFLFATGLAGLLSAQVRVSGRVSNDTGTPVSKAGITFQPPAPAKPVRILTDPTGAFSAEFPNPGQFTVTAEAAGYFALKESLVEFSAGDNDLNLTLAPIREFADSVDVQATTSTVDLDTTHTREEVSGAELLAVPFPNSHNLKSSMRILPGVVQDSRGGIHAAGASEEQSLYLLDGFNIGDPLTGKFEARIGIEAVQTMTVETGRYSAEYGKASAGVISIDTKTGDDRVRYSATNFIPGLENQKGWRIGSWNPRFNVSGPVKRGRVWFSDSFSGQFNETVIQELPTGQDTSTSLRYENFLHLQANLSPRNILQTGFLATHWNVDRAGLSPLDPPQTTLGRRTQQWFGYVKDQWYVGEGAMIEFGYAANRTFGRQSPYGNDLYLFTPYGRAGNYFVHGTQDAGRDQFVSNAYLPLLHWLGAHQIKAGVDLDRLGYAQDLRRTGYEYRRSDGSPVRRVLYEGSGNLSRTTYETSTYVQDGWRIRKDVLIDFGLRWDWNTLLRNWNTSPRTGVAWSPPGMPNTKISGGYAITYDAPNVMLFTRPMDQYAVTFLFPPYGLPSEPLTSTFYNPGRGFASPRYSNWSAAVDHRLASSTFGRIELLRRRGSRGLTYWPMVTTWPDTVYSLGNHRSDSYTSAAVTLRQNLRQEYAWMASYTWSRSRSNAVIDVSSDDPAIVAGNSGPLPWDAPHRMVGWAYVPTPWKKWAIASLAEYRTGFPYSIVNDLGSIIGGPNASRFPTFFELNFSVERQFEWRGQRWAGRVGFINITNHRNYNTVNNDINSPNFLLYSGGQSRAFNFRIRWLGKL